MMAIQGVSLRGWGHKPINVDISKAGKGKKRDSLG
jgi:hypothetical protein